MRSVSPLGRVETHMIGFRSLHVQHNSSLPDEGCETHSWMEAQNSQPTTKCKAVTPFIFSRFPIRLQEGTLAVCPLFYFLWFPVLSYSKCSRATGPRQPLAPIFSEKWEWQRHICLRAQSQVSLNKFPNETGMKNGAFYT